MCKEGEHNLEKIGLILQERRKEQGYSLEEMSVKTKLSTVQLSAIEEGNIQFFKDDLSYLSYFVRYYANALGIDYNELRNELDDTINAYTDSITVSQIKKQDEITSNVQKKSKKTKVKSKPTSKGRKKMDLQTIAMLLFAIAIVALLFFGGYKLLSGSLNVKDPIEDPGSTIVVSKEDPKEESKEDEKKPETEKPKEPEKVKLEVAQKSIEGSSVVYEVKNWVKDEKATFEFEFHNASWTSFTEDGQQLANPAAKIFNAGEKASVIFNVVEGKSLEATFGYMNGNEIKLNGEKVELDASIATLPDYATITFKFIGGAN
ncbi:helix-turn-helix domain-containing protein [Erysipelothrix rhusiopathiae]|nr:transcriptional regulator [Erysipelothrix rhusiopathiae]BAK31718.1 transcriptional regulator, XRE family [Erysipelothrix rhusiopathiae str. Fujisawa]AOO67838.1 transcriptional regulator [Erysipelothrix rhusiopathiae]MDV7678784.1 helix-turn-helix domain-containing protein [Erysipelothrix rhusiopathiae]MDV7682153.1 helix-turn-helix domain-containing protein [Erysipelothrix rhusiopathiae]